jgi:hypothetical protein
VVYIRLVSAMLSPSWNLVAYSLVWIMGTTLQISDPWPFMFCLQARESISVDDTLKLLDCK